MPGKTKSVQPFDTESWIRHLPKAELHLHLEGTISPETLVEMSRHNDAEPLTLVAARELYKYKDFTGFMLAFKAVTERLRTPDHYELITYRMIEALAAQGVVHAEVYVSVGVVYYWRRIEFEPLFEGMERGRIRGEREFGVSVFWIFDAVRHFGPEEAARVFRKAAELKSTHQSIIGIGIGGDERRTGAEPFRELYAEAKKNGLHLTVHAGETVGPEGIWSALNIGAERIGHALSAGQDLELIEVLATRQVPVEICITSNLRTGCCKGVEDHPVREYFENGVMVTLNSDDPALFGSDLWAEYCLAHTGFGLTLEHLRELAGNSIEASFLAPGKKLELLQRVEQYPAPVEM
ncbi:MAG TPA: adenosine deaminase [Acidobacteriaceae bacterium]|nr:adenosine deaminase [Acidobacteriaceae bacterium]